MFPFMLWENLGGIYFNGTVLRPSNHLVDVVRSCSTICLPVNDSKVIRCF